MWGSMTNRSNGVVRIGFLVATLAFFAALTMSDAEAKKYKVEDFARGIAMLSPKLSPDGTHLAALQPYQGRRAIFVYKLDSNEQPVMIEPGSENDIRFSRFYWATDERLIVVVVYPFVYTPPYKRWQGYKVKTTASRTMAVNRDGTKPVVLLKEIQRRVDRTNLYQANILDLLDDEPEYLLMGEDINQDGFVTVEKVNIRTGKTYTLMRGGPNTFDYQTDWDGKVRLRFDDDDIKDEVKIFLKKEDSVQWKLLSQAKWLSSSDMDPLGFSIENPNHLYILTRLKTGRRGVYLMDIVSGELIETVFEHDTFDVDGMSFFHDTHEPVGVHYIDDEPQTHYLSDRARKRAKLVKKNIPGPVKTFMSFSKDGNRQVIRSTSDSSPPVYYLMDYKEKSISEIGRWYPQLRAEDMGEVRPYYFKARDGLEIPAYLTLPKGRSRNLPTIVMPHGGPRARDGATFDYMAQLFANRGYAVVQPNFRGSEGYGEDFEHAGFKEWGLKMQDDVTDATRKVIRDGIADPKRICIVGWSYGGYASAMGIVKEPNLYKCSVAINGVYDLIEVMNKPAFWRGYHNYWGRIIGDKNGGDRPYMEHSSPAMRASEIRVPVLLITGEIDRTVLPKQARIFEAALRQSGKSVEAYYYPHGDHSLRYEPERIDAFTKIDAFLARHLGR